MRKSIALILALILGITLLAGCGGGANSNDPNIGKWTAVSASAMGMEIGVADVFENGCSVELKANGKCVLDLNGEKTNAKWTFENGVLTIDEKGDEVYGKIENDVLTLTIPDDEMEITVKFTKEGTREPAGSGNTDNDNAISESAGGAIGDMLGEYTCTGWEVNGSRTDEGAGEWLKFENATRGIVCIAEKEYPFTWSMSGNIITINEDVGLTYTATYENGVIKLDTGMLYFFEKK